MPDDPDRTPFRTIYPDADDQWQSPPGAEVSTLLCFPGEPRPCSECGEMTEFVDLGSECFVCCRACQGKFWDEFQAACDRMKSATVADDEGEGDCPF